MGYFNRMWGVFVVLVSVAGCKGSDEESNRDPDSAADPRPGCQSFQDEFCSWAERCNPGATSQCLTEVRTTFCKSEEAATACAATFDTAPCGQRSACGPEVLDRQPAADACNRLLEATCNASLRCNAGTTHEQCLAEAKAKVDCSSAVGVRPGYQGCLDALEASSCTAPPTTQCKGVIATSPPF